LTLEAGRHELSCASCGAPLRNLKMLPARADLAPVQRQAVSHRPAVRQFPEMPKAAAYKKAKPRKTSKRRGWIKEIAEELFDLVEDIFD
jgi:hypothetical protein